MSLATQRTAVVLFNLGGPDGPASVEPFLFNLFSDPAIIRLPNPLRWLVARLIARRRAPVAREIYARIGGGSPLLELTRAQAAALQSALGEGGAFRVFVAMRYWHPFAAETAAEVKAWAPERIVLLPLYPQYSTTTSASSLADWARAAAAAGLDCPTATVCCYPADAGLVAAQAALIEAALESLNGERAPRVLFSAHGLPKKVVAAGDPYQWQVEQTAAAVVAALNRPGLDWTVCYQSRVGPLEWIGPSTESEIARAGRDRVPVAVVPIAFVSEHSETLVELDIEYRHRAEAAGVPAFARVPAVGTHPAFIAGLAALVRSRAAGGGVQSGAGGRLCPRACGGCPVA
jgi:ferrochelatase